MSKRKNVIEGYIPVRSAEAFIIQRKLFDIAISAFKKYKVNMPLNEFRK